MESDEQIRDGICLKEVPSQSSEGLQTSDCVMMTTTDTNHIQSDGMSSKDDPSLLINSFVLVETPIKTGNGDEGIEENTNCMAPRSDTTTTTNTTSHDIQNDQERRYVISIIDTRNNDAVLKDKTYHNEAMCKTKQVTDEHTVKTNEMASDKQVLSMNCDETLNNIEETGCELSTNKILDDNTEQTCEINKKSTQKRNRSYSVVFKLDAIAFAEENSNRSAARKFGVDEKRVREWKKNKADIFALASSKNGHNRKRLCGGGTKPFSVELEKQIVNWINERCSQGLEVSRQLIKKEAEIIYQQMRENRGDMVECFKASNGWLMKFMRRNGLEINKKTVVAK